MKHPPQNLAHHRTRPAAARVRATAAMVGSLGLLGLLAPACGEAALDGSPPLTIAECQELGGSPLFDPEDERPAEMSCPEGLSYLGEFDEPFFGAEGGICCGGSDVAVR